MSIPWYRTYVTPVAHERGLDVRLVEAVIQQESGGHAWAYRFEPGFYARYLRDNPAYDGAEPERVSASYGLLQVMYPTAVDHGFTSEPELLFVPSINVDIGCTILAGLISWAEGTLPKALAAYNGGKGNWTASDPTRYAGAVLARLSMDLA